MTRPAAQRTRHAIAVGVVTALVGAVSTSGCGNCGAAPAPTGSVSLAWSLAGSEGVPISCDRAGATAVALVLRDRATADAITISLPCTGSPATQLVAVGTYDASIALRAADGSTLATAPSQTSVRVVVGQVTALAPVKFALSASLVLSFAASGTTANCTPATQGGAGITTFTLILEPLAGGCTPATFIRRKGAASAGTYTVSCSSPQVTSCLETDETLSAAIDPDRYVIHARGKVGTLDCWHNDDNLAVTLGAPVAHAALLASVGPSGCPTPQLGPSAAGPGSRP